MPLATSYIQQRQRQPHFFKPFLPSFNSELSIPDSFFKYLKGEKCNKALLQSSHGGNGKVWPVTLRGRVMGNGWTEFVQDHDLHEGDFLVFKHKGSMVFDVTIFDLSACKKEYPPPAPFDGIKVEEGNGLGRRNSEANQEKTFRAKATSFAYGDSYFCGTINPTNLNQSRMMIPLNFARLNGLCNRSCKMIFINQQGKSWPLKLGHYKTDGRVYVGGGWKEFVTANGIKLGDKFKLELVKGRNIPTMTYYGL